MKDLRQIFEPERINLFNVIFYTIMNVALIGIILQMGALNKGVAFALLFTLFLAWLLYLVPLSHWIKSLILPFLPTVVVFLLVLSEGGKSYHSLILLTTIVMGSLYFLPMLIVVCSAAVNFLIIGGMVMGVSMVAPSFNLAENLKHLIVLDLISIMLFFGSKWSGETVLRVERLSAQSTETGEKLRELNASLEAKVNERTWELETMVADLKAAQEHLIISDKLASLGGLVAGVAHEVNTPLGVCITAITKMESENTALVQDITQSTLTKQGLADHVNNFGESLKIVTFNLFRAAEIIRSFKEIAVDQSSEVIASFCLDDYIRTILFSLKHELKNYNAEIRINFAEMQIESYPGAFSQIITNLILNTLNHGYEPGARVQIDFDARKENGMLVFSYTDYGKGIAPDIINKIFDPFFTTRRGAGGSGLGLNIVYNIVHDKLRGTITCKSALGEYTTFTIKI